MKLTIKGLKKLDATALATTIEQWELGDIIAYGLESSRELPIKEPELTMVSNLLRAMLVSDCSYGVTWAGKICMASTEADLLPELENLEDIDHVYIQINHMIDIANWLEQNFGRLYRTCKEITADCLKTGVPVIPFTDTDYYAERFRNFMHMNEGHAELTAEWLRKFEAFQVSKQSGSNCYRYLDHLEIDVHENGYYNLILGNYQHETDNLEELEIELFIWAMLEQHCNGL